MSDYYDISEYELTPFTVSRFRLITSRIFSDVMTSKETECIIISLFCF